jgi:hypothetical protein
MLRIEVWNHSYWRVLQNSFNLVSLNTFPCSGSSPDIEYQAPVAPDIRLNEFLFFKDYFRRWIFRCVPTAHWLLANTLFHHFHSSKISYVGIVIKIKQNIKWFYVSVNNFFILECFQTLCNLLQNHQFLAVWNIGVIRNNVFLEVLFHAVLE